MRTCSSLHISECIYKFRYSWHTGCDSGFGNRLAISLDELGFLVFAGCLFPEQEGALSLLERSSRRIQVVKVDVTSDESVRGAVHFVENNLGTNSRSPLGSLVDGMRVCLS